MSKISLDKPIREHLHIDNGGITVSLVDKGAAQGLWFEISTEYFGYPGLHTSLQIDHYGDAFLAKLEAMVKQARKELKTIDWEQRMRSLDKKGPGNSAGECVHGTWIACVPCRATLDIKE